MNAKYEPQPENMFDANAIRVLYIDWLGFKHSGYIAQELTNFVHQLLNKVGFRAKIGYYLTKQVTSKG